MFHLYRAQLVLCSDKSPQLNFWKDENRQEDITSCYIHTKKIREQTRLELHLQVYSYCRGGDTEEG